ncbi:MAG: hypothetical protein M1598_08345 [Actinobacteria bacterium]|nr:hypothetical protein [Actinomycetota bacterium]
MAWRAPRGERPLFTELSRFLDEMRAESEKSRSKGNYTYGQGMQDGLRYVAEALERILARFR